MRRREKVSSASALSTFLPRMLAATSLSLRALVRIDRVIALASLSESERLRCGLLMALFLCRLLVARRMAVEGPGRRELAEFVTDHVLGDEHRNDLRTVVNLDGQADELRKDRRPAAPGLDRRIAATGTRGFRLLQQIPVDERAFPKRTCHGLPLTATSCDRGDCAR